MKLSPGSTVAYGDPMTRWPWVSMLWVACAPTAPQGAEAPSPLAPAGHAPAPEAQPAPAAASPSDDEPTDAEEEQIAASLAILCARVMDQSLSAWSQAVLPSRRVLNLAIAIDRGDVEASCELGRWMTARDLRDCDEVAEGLLASCETP